MPPSTMQTREVVLVLDAPAATVVPALERLGVVITSRAQAEHGLLYARVPAGRLAEVEAVPGVASVTPDSEQRAF